jgi:hypothetical protein
MHTFFAELRDINKIRMQIWEMEEGEGAFSHDKESQGQNISVGNPET